MDTKASPILFPDMKFLADPLFLESLSEPLKSFALNAVLSSDGVSSSSSSSAVLLDLFEIQLRQEVLNRIRDAEKVGEFWKDATRVCWHMVHMAENQKEQEEDTNKDESSKNHYRYKHLASVRKIPILLLEDILDSVTLSKALDFYNNHAKPMFPLLFGDLLWRPELKVRPCWLPFLKVANKFTKRLSAHQLEDLKYKDAISSIMLTLCQIYPLSEKSATKAWGSYNDQSNTTFEGREEFEQEQAPVLEFSASLPSSSSSSNHHDDDGEDGAIPDYTVYESFWKLQKDFSRPNSLDVSGFLQRLRSLLTTLEHTPVPSNKNKNPSATTDAQSRIAASTSRYLTSSRLLSIQLQDADFRIPILTQVLIICHHLMHISPVVLKAKLSEWQNRAITLLQNVSPEQYNLLQSILRTSEESWRQWKQNKGSPDLDQRKSEPLLGRKRKRSGLGSTKSLSDGSHSNTAMDGKDSATVMDLPKVSRQMRQAAPSLKSHLEEYVEALDPESGIEAEYHPKSNALFSWRAVRLLSATHLSDLHLLNNNGDFERVVRTIYARDYGTDIPGPMPPEDEVFNEEEEEAEVEEVAEEATKDQEDVTMKDEEIGEDQVMVEERRDQQQGSDAGHGEEGLSQSESQDEEVATDAERPESGAQSEDTLDLKPLVAIKEESDEEQEGAVSQDEKEEGEYRKEPDQENQESRVVKKPVDGPSDKAAPAPSGNTEEGDAGQHIKSQQQQQRYAALTTSRDSKRHAETSTTTPPQRRGDYSQLDRRGGGGSDYRSNSRDNQRGSERDGPEQHTGGGSGREDGKNDRGGGDDSWSAPARGSGVRPPPTTTSDDRGGGAGNGNNSDNRLGARSSGSGSEGRRSGSEGRQRDDQHHQHSQDRDETHRAGGGGRSSDTRKSVTSDDRGGGRSMPHGDDSSGLRREDRGRPVSRGGGGGEDRSSTRPSDDVVRGSSGAGRSSNPGVPPDESRSSNYVSRGGGGGGGGSVQHERSHDHGGSRNMQAPSHSTTSRNPAPDDRGRNPAPDDRGRNPATDDRGRNPATDDRGRNPATDDRGRNPATDDRGRNPATDDRGRNPATDDRGRNPATDDRGRNPATDDRGRNPATDDRGRNPATDDRGRGSSADRRSDGRGGRGDRRGGDDGGAGGGTTRSEWRGGDRNRSRPSGHRGDRRHRH
ncbi:hypothetical protein ACA910_009081 [Epithemia clementina (nom. ined.)]